MIMATTSLEAQFVTFSLGEEIFAVPVEVVREILDYAEAFKIPNVPTICSACATCAGRACRRSIFA